jgi:ABC-2 type transport system permease protein
MAKKYFSIFTLAVIHSLKNYKALVGLNLFLITCLLVFAHLWKVAATKIGAVDLDPDQLLWYIAFNEWVLIAIPEVQTDMEQDLRSGKLAYLLPRPISYLGATFAAGLGSLCVNLTGLGLVTFLFTWWRVGSFPFDLGKLLIILGLGLLAGVVGVIFQMMVGLSAFWLKEVTPVNWIWEKLLFAVGGLILPLAIYPIWIQKIAYWTPFPAILGQRSALAIHFSAAEVLQVTASLLLWGVVGLGCVTLLYRRGLKILNVEGG